MKEFKDLTPDARREAMKLKPSNVEFLGMGKFDLFFSSPIGEYHSLAHRVIEHETGKAFVIVSISPDRKHLQMYSFDAHLEKTGNLFYNVGEPMFDYTKLTTHGK